MITVEDKIRTFSKYVYDKEVKQKDEVLQQEMAKQERLRKEAKERLEDKTFASISKQKKKLDLEAQRMLSAAKQEARDILHETRGKLYGDLLEEMKKTILEYVNTQEYQELLKHDLQKILEQGTQTEMRLFVRLEDQKAVLEFIGHTHPNVQVDELGEEFLGGVLVEFPQQGTRMDHTWATKLSELENELGVSLYEVLDEAVANHD